MKITKDVFGITKNGQVVQRYYLENTKGTRVAVLTLGGIIQAFVFQGTDVVLGFDNIAAYEAQDAYIGALVGRFANRIGGGKFRLNGKEHVLYINNGPNHLHGGKEGFDCKIWQAEAKEDALILSYTAADGEEGYPGVLRVSVAYALDEADGLSLTYTARSDCDTVINLTNHSYFNLSGHTAGHLNDHEVQLFAESFTENDEDCLPTGRILQVAGTPMDFRLPHSLTERIDMADVQLQNGNGYDHNWVIDGAGFRKAAYVKSKATGIGMYVETDQPGVQMYTANFLNLDRLGKEGAKYPCRSAVCFETQGFPDAPNHTHFPTAVLKAGEDYLRKTVYRLEIEKREV